MIYLVRAGVIEVFAFEVDFRATEFLREIFREEEWRRASHVIRKKHLVFLLERWIYFRLFVRERDFVQRDF